MQRERPESASKLFSLAQEGISDLRELLPGLTEESKRDWMYILGEKDTKVKHFGFSHMRKMLVHLVPIFEECLTSKNILETFEDKLKESRLAFFFEDLNSIDLALKDPDIDGKLLGIVHAFCDIIRYLLTASKKDVL